MNIKIGESLAQRIQMTRGNNMESMKFSRELYPKVALIKEAYNYYEMLRNKKNINGLMKFQIQLWLKV